MPRFVVCGDDPLAYSLAEELTSRYDAQVTVILPSRRHNYGPQIAALGGVRIVEAGRLDTDTFRAARLAGADGLALVRQDDVGNIEAALRAQEIQPQLRLVIRMFNVSLGYGLRRLLPEAAVLSDAAIAAPEFAAAALGEIAPTFVRVSGRTLRVARRDQVRAPDVICGLAATAGDRPEILPADGDTADLVLAVTRRGQYPLPASERDESAAGRPWHRGRTRRRRTRRVGLVRLVQLVDSKLEIALLILLVVFLAGVVAIGAVDGLSPWHAFYTSLLIALDAGDADLDSGLPRQIAQTVIAIAGIALVPVVTAAVVNASVKARMAKLMGYTWGGHMVVVGLGDLGTRVIRLLHELGHDVVAVDQSETSRGAQTARELDIPLVIGDASRGDTLRRSSAHTCRALLALSTSDVINLTAALRAREMQPGLRVVLRLFDNDFARRVENAFGIPTSRSVSALAAPTFASALLGQQVVGTIAVGRQVLVLAEIWVAERAKLAGRPVARIDTAGEVRVVAHTAAGAGSPTWSPAPDVPVRGGDRLLVVATREGLSRVLSGTSPNR